MMKKYKYDQRGVSADKEEVHDAIRDLDNGVFPNAFCKVSEDIVGGDSSYCNIIHADTAGTKTSLGYLWWKESGDLSVWRGIAQDAMVMNIDDLACVGCVSGIVVSSTIGRNKNLIPGDVIKEIIAGKQAFCQRMSQLGIDIHYASGETADVGDIVRTIDVGVTAFARMKKAEVVVNDIQPGDVVVGFSSYGKTTYEDQYNGGIGSNGLTSARHDVLRHAYSHSYPESFDPNTSRSLIYCGTRDLKEMIKIGLGNGKISLGNLLLSPTRTYAPIIKDILKEHRSSIHGMIHCSGGGQTKVLHFIKGLRIVKDNMLAIPPLFGLIEEESGTSREEMYKVFNMGHRFEVYTDESTASALIAIAQSYEMDAQIIGHVESADRAEVMICDAQATYTYY